MNEIVRFGNLGKIGIEVVEKGADLFVRYDAGSHHVFWREDKITREEFKKISESESSRIQVMFQVQKRLEEEGINPYESNWKPE